MTLRAKLTLDGFCDVRYTDSDASPRDLHRLGSSLFPRWILSLTDGTTAGKAQLQYHRKHTIAASGDTTIDLTAAATERFGNIDFDKVRVMVFRIRTPAAGTKITIGNAAANQFSAWLSGATVTEDCADITIRTNPYDGWTVDATHKNLKIANPSAVSVDVDVWIIGY